MHYGKIRRSHKGTALAGLTRSWLLKERRAEIALLSELGSAPTEYEQTGRCIALVMPTSEVLTAYGRSGGRQGHLCGEPGMQRGFCARHFTTHVLYLPDR
jgi:hypothetical protein